jgi:uncharacterized BrkB/YihY/UPF0761 family membrane protein
MRSRNRVVETGFRVLERDARIAGGVLGGGLAYRLFFWTLALSVLLFGGLGFTSAGDAESAANSASLGSNFATTIGNAAAQSQASRWWLLLTGIVLVIWFAFMLLRALRLVQASAWQVPSGHGFPRPTNVLTVIAVPAVFVLVSALTGVAANLLGPFSGVVAFLLGIAIVTGLVMLGMSWLPSKPAPVYAHLPGAIVLAIVIQTLGAVGEFFIANQLASSEALYGVLGLAGTLLFVLYMIGRTTVWACELNAITWDVWFNGGAASVPPAAD